MGTLNYARPKPGAGLQRVFARLAGLALLLELAAFGYISYSYERNMNWVIFEGLVVLGFAASTVALSIAINLAYRNLFVMNEIAWFAMLISITGFCCPVAYWCLFGFL